MDIHTEEQLQEILKVYDPLKKAILPVSQWKIYGMAYPGENIKTEISFEKGIPCQKVDINIWL